MSPDDCITTCFLGFKCGWRYVFMALPARSRRSSGIERMIYVEGSFFLWRRRRSDSVAGDEEKRAKFVRSFSGSFPGSSPFVWNSNRVWTSFGKRGLSVCAVSKKRTSAGNSLCARRLTKRVHCQIKGESADVTRRAWPPDLRAPPPP